jgi:hypothetical protein
MADWYGFLVTFSRSLTEETRRTLCREFTERDYDFPVKTIVEPGFYSPYREPLKHEVIVNIFNKHGVSGQFWMYRSGSPYCAYTDARRVDFGPEVTDPFQTQTAFWEQERQKILDDRVQTYLKLCRSFEVSSLPYNPVAVDILGWHFALDEESVRSHKNMQPYIEFPPPSTVRQFQDAIKIAIGNSR